MRVGLFVTCLVDLMRPSVGFATLRLLEHADCEVTVPETQTCCGQPGFNSGDQHTTRDLAIKFLDEFETFDYVVAPSGSCIGMIKKHYLTLFEPKTETHTRLSQLIEKTFEITDFLVSVLKIQSLPPPEPDRVRPKVVTYHDSCSGLRELKIKHQPRTLLAMQPEIELHEMKIAETCCGFGGTFAVKYGDISGKMVENKCCSALETHAEAIVGGDIGCLMNIEGYLKRHGHTGTRVLHITELLTGLMSVKD